MIKGEIEFKLTQPFDYFSKNTPKQERGEKGDTTAETILMRGPSASNYQYAADIKGYLLGAFKGQEGQEGSKKDVTPKVGAEKDVSLECDEILFLLQGSKVAYKEIIGTFKELLLAPNICKTNGVDSMEDAVLEKLSFEDLEDMLGVYVESFLLRSVIRMLEKHS